MVYGLSSHRSSFKFLVLIMVLKFHLVVEALNIFRKCLGTFHYLHAHIAPVSITYQVQLTGFTAG